MNTPYNLTQRHVENYWRKVEKAGSDECWLWTGWTTADGYGRLDVGRWKPLATHLALTFDGRPRPSEKHLALHGDCSTPQCCNPGHLRWGLAVENAADRERLQRRKPARGERSGQAKLTEDDVRYIRTSLLSQRALATELGVSQPLIGHVRRRKTWTHVD